ncbi:MAG: carbonic anhydrase [Epsilonproteobacteria bacterium]|nr:carbonic anhydrase [Campylobacterota bacterium]NPA56642.1 carbonic anhydrase [Campylobacterota bacterium]
MRQILLSLAVSLSVAVASGGGKVHWGYSGDVGPAHWGDLDPAFRMCKEGVNQSPVDLNRFIEGELPKLDIVYSGNARSVVNNGHTIKVTTMGPNITTVDGIKFKLLQFHFHTPSENRVEGKSFPMEAHFVHRSDGGDYLVVALFFVEGKENKALEKILNDLSGEEGKEVQLREMFNPGELFPRVLDYYRYNGSFTTPPCTEGVRWILFKESVTASKEQIERFRKVMGENNRPVQPLKARVILK